MSKVNRGFALITGVLILLLGMGSHSHAAGSKRRYGALLKSFGKSCSSFDSSSEVIQALESLDTTLSGIRSGNTSSPECSAGLASLRDPISSINQNSSIINSLRDREKREERIKGVERLLSGLQDEIASLKILQVRLPDEELRLKNLETQFSKTTEELVRLKLEQLSTTPLESEGLTQVLSKTNELSVRMSTAMYACRGDQAAFQLIRGMMPEVIGTISYLVEASSSTTAGTLLIGQLGAMAYQYFKEVKDNELDLQEALDEIQLAPAVHCTVEYFSSVYCKSRQNNLKMPLEIPNELSCGLDLLSRKQDEDIQKLIEILSKTNSKKNLNSYRTSFTTAASTLEKLGGYLDYVQSQGQLARPKESPVEGQYKQKLKDLLKKQEEGKSLSDTELALIDRETALNEAIAGIEEVSKRLVRMRSAFRQHRREISVGGSKGNPVENLVKELKSVGYIASSGNTEDKADFSFVDDIRTLHRLHMQLAVAAAKKELSRLKVVRGVAEQRSSLSADKRTEREVQAFEWIMLLSQLSKRSLDIELAQAGANLSVHPAESSRTAALKESEELALDMLDATTQYLKPGLEDAFDQLESSDFERRKYLCRSALSFREIPTGIGKHCLNDSVFKLNKDRPWKDRACTDFFDRLSHSVMPDLE